MVYNKGVDRFADDLVLRFLPGIDDLPSAFWRLPLSEQRWRGRLYLAAWVLTDGHAPMAWHFALAEDGLSVRRGRHLVETIDDARLIEEVERRYAEGKRP